MTINYQLPTSNSSFAVAVSGGADSMALLLLSQDWIKKHGGKLVALTVDHGLRVEAAEEARTVHTWCKTHGIAHETLTWKPPKLTSAIQAQARDARYRLLTEYCKKKHIPYLLTAHHQGDQAETLFFRLARGSGIDGLACMKPVSEVNGVQLLRPLLATPKAELQHFLQKKKQPWIEDPTNQNLNYTRNYIRSLIAASNDPDAICAQAYRVSHAFQKIRERLEKNTAAKMASCVSWLSNDSASIDATEFLMLEPEYGLRILASMVQKIGAGEHKPRNEKLARFYRSLCENIRAKTNKKCTFSRCLFKIQLKNQTILVTLEHP